jgi:hypothetical protein
MDEAVEWPSGSRSRRGPGSTPGQYGAEVEIEIRQVFEVEGVDASN